MNDQEAQVLPVLVVDLAKRYGGAEVRVLDIARALQGRIPYAVATLAGSPLHQRLEAEKLVSLPVPFSRGDPRLLLFFFRAIRRGAYQVLDAHNVQSQFWGHLSAVLAGLKNKVSTVHSAYKLEHKRSLRGWFYEQILRLNLFWRVRFIAVSQSVQAYLQGIGIPGKNISVIHNSLHLSSPSSLKRDVSFRRSLGWPEDAYIFISVGRLEPVKGHAYLIDAISQVVEKRPQIHCLIVGDGRARNALETQVRQCNLKGRVHLTGFRSDVPTLMSISDAFCLPSLSEGLPYALLEACGHRLPLLVTKVGGMAELLTHKHTAFFVPPSDSNALAEGLFWLIDHPKETAIMGQTAFGSLQQRFNTDEMISATLTLYQ